MTRNVEVIFGCGLLRACGLCAALAVPQLATGVAMAGDVCGDKTCDKGFICQTYEMGSCTSEAPVDLGRAGAASVQPGADPIQCQTTTSYECVPGPCTVDTDCADGMVCHTSTISECMGGTTPACDSTASDCVVDVKAQPTSCTTTEVQKCVARYQLPCTTASDCGPGFACEEQASCWCTGTSGAAGGAESVDRTSEITPPQSNANEPNQQCGCEPSGTFACQLQVVACNLDSDCPSGLLCVANPNSACSIDPAGTTTCPAPDPAKVCQPKYGGSTVPPGGTGSSMGSGGQTSTLPPPTNDTGTTDAPAGHRHGGGHLGRPPVGQLPLGGWGCSVTYGTGAGASNLGSLALALGLAFGFRRRRAGK
jgi:hypothetical protein